MLTKDFVIKKNERILNKISIEKNLSENTILSYRSILNEYSLFNNLIIKDLITEAEIEEENGILLEKRKIKKRLQSYNQYLKENNNQPLTINTKMSKVKSLYNFYDVEVPRISEEVKRVHKPSQMLPSKEDIQLVLDNTYNLRFRALILFILSSGTALSQCLNITIDDFIKSTKKYHNEVNLKPVLNILSQKDNIIPTFHLYNSITNHSHVTFCSPEAVTAILNHLNNQLFRNKHLNRNSKLFDIKETTIQAHFRRMNDKLEFGYAGQCRFFHSRALRKYFKNELLEAGMDEMTVEYLLGNIIHKKQDTHFDKDADKLKEKYVKLVDRLIINENYNVRQYQGEFSGLRNDRIKSFYNVP